MSTTLATGNAAWTARAAAVLPGGAMGAQFPASHPFVATHGKGSKIYDADNNAYLDYVLGSGPLILGHAHPTVNAAVAAQLERGSHFYALNAPAIELAERIVAAVPCAEKVKYTSTGSEATGLAMRLARAYTGRDKILKFEGGYHGHGDYAVVAHAPRTPTDYPLGKADSAGVPQAVTDTVLVAPFNDLAAAREIIDCYHDELAAVIVEPYQRVIPPQPGFLQGLREATQAHGIVLIFDEVVTGFRLAWGGAQEHYGVVPDIAAYGKTIGGGYPLAAVAGHADLIDLTDPSRRASDDRYAYAAGTFNGNPLAAAAGVATLNTLAEPGTYKRLHAICDRLGNGFQAMLDAAKIPAQVLWDGPIMAVLFTATAVTNYQAAQTAHPEQMRAWYEGLLQRGFLVNPAVQKFYLSTVHTEEDIDATLVAAEEIVAIMRQQISAG